MDLKLKDMQNKLNRLEHVRDEAPLRARDKSLMSVLDNQDNIQENTNNIRKQTDRLNELSQTKADKKVSLCWLLAS